MAQNVGSTKHSSHAQSARNQERTTTDNQFTKLVAEKIEDGKLSPESISALSQEVTKLQHPRDRAHAKNELRAAIRENPDLSAAERRAAITELNKTMAQSRPGWAASATADVAGATANAAEKSATAKTIGDVADTGAPVTQINPDLNRVKNAPLLLANMPLRA